MINRSKDLLLELGLASDATIEPFYHCVRDRDDVGVLRDTRSGVIFLDRTDHMTLTHYEDAKGGTYWGAEDRATALLKYAEDDERRAKQFAADIAGKDVVDVGCGTGGFMDLVRSGVKSISGAEPQDYMREELTRAGYSMHKLASDLPAQSFDVATLFHVLEHVIEPLDLLRDVKRALRPGGSVIIEVPHARDALLAHDSFKAYTLWSEHLILHTKESLQKFLETAGFSNITVEGYQRHPLANHLGWLLTGEPGGQKKFADLVDETLAARYARRLVEFDKTDTLIAKART